MPTPTNIKYKKYFLIEGEPWQAMANLQKSYFKGKAFSKQLFEAGFKSFRYTGYL